MSDFFEISLGDEIDFFNGKSIKPGQDGGYPAYGANGRIGSSPEWRHENSIIIGRVGAYCGAVAYCKSRFWASDNTIVAKPKNGDVRYFYYLLKHLGLNRYAGGSAQPLVTQTVLKGVQAKVSDIETQRRIASILSAYDDLIENNTRRSAILEEMARRIYEEWFVHFRFPGHEQVKMVESELGLIPEGWSLRKLGEVVELAYGKALKAEDRKQGIFPVYGSSGVVGSHDEPLVDGPGIIIGRKGNVGSVHWCETPFFPIDTVYFVRTSIPLYYVFFNLKRQHFINNDAAVPGLNRNQAYSLPFLVPSEEVLGQFVKHCLSIFKQLRILAATNANLRTTRDLLLPKLISGELDVSNLPNPKEVSAA